MFMAGVATFFRRFTYFAESIFGDHNEEGWAQSLVVFAAFEAYFESVPQLILQIFSILKGYPSSGIQLVTIFTSALMIVKTGIQFDLKVDEEEGRGERDINYLYIIRIIPLYMSALFFRIAAVTFIATYLRYWSLIPILLSLIETCIIVACCIRFDVTLMFFVTLSSIGGTNTGMIQLMDYFFNKTTNSKKMKRFMKISNITTFFHHTITLIIILILVKTCPTILDHWTDGTLIAELRPCHYHIITIFNNIFCVGIINLLLSLYSTRDIQAGR